MTLTETELRDALANLESFRWLVTAASVGILRPVWPAGRNSLTDDGGHWVLEECDRPVSVSTKEAVLLALLAADLAPDAIVEIGTGFGYSSAWLAYGAWIRRGWTRLITVDDGSESTSGEAARRVRSELHRRLGIEGVEALEGSSPGVLADVEIPAGSLGFIDGNHHGNQPLLDYQAVRLCCSGGLVVFHDNDHGRYTVGRAVDAAQSDGLSVTTLRTSCSMAVTGSHAAVARAQSLWDEVDERLHMDLA
jgi:predicted O-methyltransferase YrrM